MRVTSGLCAVTSAVALASLSLPFYSSLLFVSIFHLYLERRGADLPIELAELDARLVETGVAVVVGQLVVLDDVALFLVDDSLIGGIDDLKFEGR